MNDHQVLPYYVQVYWEDQEKIKENQCSTTTYWHDRRLNTNLSNYYMY